MKHLPLFGRGKTKGNANEETASGDGHEHHSYWHSFRLHFSNNAVKRPGYVEGPWFNPPENFSEKAGKQETPVKTEADIGEKIPHKSRKRHGSSTVPKSFPAGRIEGPWFSFQQQQQQQVLASRSSDPITNVDDQEDITVSSSPDSFILENDPNLPEMSPSHVSSLVVAPNVFSRMSTPFPAVPVDPSNRISTPQFLEACRQMLTIIDLLGGRAFAPVKADVLGNIGKLQNSADGDPVQGGTLQGLILAELERTNGAMGTAGEALLWLKRSLCFVDEFLGELLQTEEEPRECAVRAYKRSLQEHHNFIVRTAFQVAMFALPSRRDFMAALVEREGRGAGRSLEKEPAVVAGLIGSAEEYWRALKRLLHILNDFYAQNKLPP